MSVKATILCLTFVCLFYPGYSQIISTPVPATDTLSKKGNDSIARDNSNKLQVRNSLHLPADTRSGKQPVYKLCLAADIPIIVIGSGFSLYSTTKIYKKGPSTVAQIMSLKKSDINAFDRWSVRPYSQPLDHISYYPFYASIPVPFILILASKDTRHDFWELSFLYWEAMSISGLFGGGGPYFIDRYRPYAYSSGTPMDQRIIQNAKNSAFSGHVELVSTSVFFIAKVYGDYYPNRRLLMYTIAAVSTAGMGYLRLQAGMHFPSDVLVGAAIGTLSGILVPEFHKHRLIKNPNISLTPYGNQQSKGLAFIYNIR